MNPQTWTKVGANRSSGLTASPDFWMFDLLKPPSAPLVSRKGICLAYIHSQMNLHMCATFGANRSIRLTATTYFWICDPLKSQKCPPGILRGNCIWPICPFPDESADVHQVCANRSSCLTGSQDFWICDPLKTIGALRGELYLAYVDSQTNYQTCTKFGGNRSSRLKLPQTFEFVTP